MCYVYLGLTSNRSPAVPEWLARGLFRTRPQSYCFFLTYASKLKIFVPKDKKILRFVVPEDKKNASPGRFFVLRGISSVRSGVATVLGVAHSRNVEKLCGKIDRNALLHDFVNFFLNFARFCQFYFRFFL